MAKIGYNLVGKRFGKLLVLNKIRKKGTVYWHCVCSCKNHTEAITADLVRGHIKSCGCLRRENGLVQGHLHEGFSFKNLKGNRYGRLTVLERDKNQGEFVTWRCRCDCGTFVTVRAQGLLNGSSKSCGCYQRDVIRELGRKNGRDHIKLAQLKCTKFKDPYEGAKNDIYIQYKSNARNKRRVLSISFSEFCDMISLDCFYCGSPPSTIRKYRGIEIKYNGLDRLDCSKGYTKENVVTCCFLCNRAKNDLSKKDFLDLVTRVYRHQQLS